MRTAMRNPMPADYGLTEDEYAVACAIAVFGDVQAEKFVNVARYFAAKTGESLAFCLSCVSESWRDNEAPAIRDIT